MDRLEFWTAQDLAPHIWGLWMRPRPSVFAVAVDRLGVVDALARMRQHAVPV